MIKMEGQEKFECMDCGCYFWVGQEGHYRIIVKPIGESWKKAQELNVRIFLNIGKETKEFTGIVRCC
jgi:hypothetical protein